MIKTDCTKCVFNFNSHNQMEASNRVYCTLDRFKKFEEMGDVSEDGTTINKLCTTCRNEAWADNQIKDYETAVKDELKNVYSLIIVDEEPGDILGRLRKTLRIRQDLYPRQIVFVYSNDYRMSELTPVFDEYVKGTSIKYQLLRIFDQEYPREIIDIAVKNIDGMFYTIVKNGDILPRDFLYSLYHTIDVNLDRFLIIKPIKDLTGLTVLRLYHHKVNGNYTKFVEDKLEEDGEAWMIKTYQQILSQSKDMDTFYKEIINGYNSTNS